MKLFCTFCGAPQELDAPPARVTCTQCGKAFAVQQGSQANPTAPAVKTAAKAAGGVGLVVVLLGVGGLCFVAVIGMMAAIAIPNFIKFQARSKQAEAKANLKALYVSEVSFFETNQRYSTDFKELGFSVEPGNRYAYFADGSGASPTAVLGVDLRRYKEAQSIAAADLPELAVRPGIEGKCPQCEITLVAAGNIDPDPTLDVWSVSTSSRKDAAGALIPAGVPHNDVDDTRE